jgi:hypothetical protein
MHANGLMVSSLSPPMFRGLVGLYLTRTCGFKNREYVMTNEVALFIHELAYVSPS